VTDTTKWTYLDLRGTPSIQKKLPKTASQEARETQEDLLRVKAEFEEAVATEVNTTLQLVYKIIDKAREPRQPPHKDWLDYAQWVVLSAIATALVGMFVQTI
jgi:hypothetical protein